MRTLQTNPEVPDGSLIGEEFYGTLGYTSEGLLIDENEVWTVVGYLDDNPDSPFVLAISGNYKRRLFYSKAQPWINAE